MQNNLMIKIIIILLITITLPNLSTAQWIENVLTNELNEDIYVVFSTWRPEQFEGKTVISQGYRTVGYYRIQPGGSHSFYAWGENVIYLQIRRSSGPAIKPTSLTQTHKAFVHLSLPFRYVTSDPIEVSNELYYNTQYSDRNFNDLVPSDGFIKYNKGTNINVTSSWVYVRLPEGIVNIPDPALRLVISLHLGKAEDEPITAQEMRTLDSIFANENNIKDLTGIEFATSLTFLYLDYNQITDISPISRLASLEYLDLNENRITDISPLAELTSLRYLYLNNNRITDISHLAGLTSLVELFLQRNLITDVSPLAGLTSLRDLDLNNNHILNFSPIAELIPRLLSYTNADQTPPPAPNTVYIPDAKLRAAIEEALGKPVNTTITPAEMRTLTSFSADLQRIVDITGLESATSLTQLSLQENGITDISPLTGLTSLRSLHLNENTITDISPLSGLTSLVGLYLDENRITDISPLTGLTSLEALYLNENQITDISPLASLTSLKYLLLVKNKITDISPLAVLNELRALRIRDNQIFDYSYLLLLPNLSIVHADNGIDDMDSLRSVIEGAGCHFAMPSSYGTFKPSTHEIMTTTEAHDGGISGNVPIFYAAPIVHNNKTLNWTYETTVASESQNDPTTITMKFLNGNELNIAWVKAAARTWQDNGHLKFKFLEPNQSGPSDIRVKFESKYYREVTKEQKEINGELQIVLTPTGKAFTYRETWSYMPPSEKHSVLPFNEYWSAYGTRANNLQGQETMHFTTGFGIDTALHEIGHALGLAHEHLSPKFNKYFEWVDTTEVIDFYQKRNPAYTAKRIRENLLVTVPVAAELPGVDFDPDSIMAYGIPAELINARPDAPQWAQDIATKGLEQKSQLSVLDRAIIATLYPKPKQMVVAGTISVYAKDDDIFSDDYFDNRKEPETFAFDHTHHNPLLKYVNKVKKKFTWGDRECRVEVHLCVRNFDASSETLEVGVYALLYEEKAGSEGKDDLEDIECTTFKIPVNGEATTKLPKLVNGSLFSLKKAQNPCPEVYQYDIDELYFGDASGGGDWAEVTVWVIVGDRALNAPGRVSVPDVSPMDVNGDGQIDATDLMIPEKTVLLPNYPNPFNPETWIPYHLSEPAAVTLTIYSIDGKVVKHLHLGNQAAGYYRTKNRAIYWDGRNNFGEPVGSGVYFYSLNVGNSILTKKMLIRK